MHKQEVDIKVLALHVEVVLAAIEGKSAAELGKRLGHALCQGLLHCQFLGLRGQAEEIEDQGVLGDVLGKFRSIRRQASGLQTALKDLMAVSVIGFKEQNVYCPPTQTIGSKTFNRKGEKIGINRSGFNCKTDSTRDWRSLINDPNAVKVSK